MANGIILKDSLTFLKKETTEGVYVAPAAATDFFQPNTDGMEIIPSKDWHSSNRLTNSLSTAKPRGGIKKAESKIALELRASGTEGAAPQWGILFESLLGATRANTTEITTKSSGNTTTSLAIEDADITKFAVGDIFVIKKANAYHMTAVKAITGSAGSWALTIEPACPAAPGNAVKLSKFTTYYVADNGHPSFSNGIYWADKILQYSAGNKTKSASLSNFKTGQIAKLDFEAQAMKYGTDTAATAGFTPTYDSALSPVILNCIIYQNGTAIVVDEFSFKFDATIAQMTSTADANGTISQRQTARAISGAFAPYKDDTSVANFTAFDAETSYSVFIMAANPDPANAGQYLLGTCFGIYMPNCISKTLKVDNLNGVLRDAIGYEAHGGDNGTTKECYIGFI